MQISESTRWAVTGFIFRFSVCFPAPQITAAAMWAAKGLLGPLSPGALRTKATAGRAGCICFADCVQVPHNCINSSSKVGGFFIISKISLGVKKNLMLHSLHVLQTALFQALFATPVMFFRQNVRGKGFVLLSQHVHFCQLKLTRIYGDMLGSVVWLLFLATFPSYGGEKVSAKMNDFVQQDTA